MPNYRRAWVPGGTFFFTIVTHRRRPVFADAAAQALLGSVFRRCLLRRPFQLVAIVLLPDHLHATWSLPPGDADYSGRWSWIKSTFTKEWLRLGSVEADVSRGRQKERRRSAWQPRFWEHTLESVHDSDHHFDCIHYNPVKHDYVACPFHWSTSSFHRWVAGGVYPAEWACSQKLPEPLSFDDIKETVGE